MEVTSSEVIPVCDFKFSSIELNLFPQKRKHDNCDTLSYQEIRRAGIGCVSLGTWERSSDDAHIAALWLNASDGGEQPGYQIIAALTGVCKPVPPGSLPFMGSNSASALSLAPGRENDGALHI